MNSSKEETKKMIAKLKEIIMGESKKYPCDKVERRALDFYVNDRGNKYESLSSKKGSKYAKEDMMDSDSIIGILSNDLFSYKNNEEIRDPLLRMYDSKEEWAEATKSRLEYEKKKRELQFEMSASFHYNRFIKGKL